MELQAYTDADFALTVGLETDPEVMRELGGPMDHERLPDVRGGSLRAIVVQVAAKTEGPPSGREGCGRRGMAGDVHETGWMVLPERQGRGIASAALRLLIERVRAEPRFPSVHAFPPMSDAPSNALSRKLDSPCAAGPPRRSTRPRDFYDLRRNHGQRSPRPGEPLNRERDSPSLEAPAARRARHSRRPPRRQLAVAQ